jgi:hypothetical protein
MLTVQRVLGGCSEKSSVRLKTAYGPRHTYMHIYMYSVLFVCVLFVCARVCKSVYNV